AMSLPSGSKSSAAALSTIRCHRHADPAATTTSNAIGRPGATPLAGGAPLEGGERSVTGRRAIPILALALAMQAGTALDPLVIPRPASAHNPPFTNVMNAFVKIEPREAQVVV